MEHQPLLSSSVLEQSILFSLWTRVGFWKRSSSILHVLLHSLLLSVIGAGLVIGCFSIPFPQEDSISPAYTKDKYRFGILLYTIICAVFGFVWLLSTDFYLRKDNLFKVVQKVSATSVKRTAKRHMIAIVIVDVISLLFAYGAWFWLMFSNKQITVWLFLQTAMFLVGITVIIIQGILLIDVFLLVCDIYKRAFTELKQELTDGANLSNSTDIIAQHHELSELLSEYCSSWQVCFLISLPLGGIAFLASYFLYYMTLNFVYLLGGYLIIAVLLLQLSFASFVSSPSSFLREGTQLSGKLAPKMNFNDGHIQAFFMYFSACTQTQRGMFMIYGIAVTISQVQTIATGMITLFGTTTAYLLHFATE